MENTGRVVVLAGPSGVGKGTVVRQLVQDYPGAYVSVSATTRDPRPGEVDGQHYHFVSEADFDRMIAHDELLEWALVHGMARYGTPAAPIRAALQQGQPVLVEIDLAGARQIRQTCPQALLVFLSPPSAQELVGRLTGRATETPAQIEARLNTARVEMAARSEFDVEIINVDVAQAARELAGLLGLV